LRTISAALGEQQALNVELCPIGGNLEVRCLAAEAV